MGPCQSKNTNDGVSVISDKTSGFPHHLCNLKSSVDVSSSNGITDNDQATISFQVGSDTSTVSSNSAGALINDDSMNKLPLLHNSMENTQNVNTANKSGHVLGYSSGASTPVSLDESHHGYQKENGAIHNSLGSSNHNSRHMVQSSSVLGLDKLIDDRRHEGDLKNNIVHMEVPFGKPIEEVYDGVHDGLVLGSGISGLVRLCTHKATGAKYATKCLDLGLVETEEGLQQLREEIAIMCQLDHPNIVRLEEVYESHSEIYLVQELCVGGELFDRLDEQSDYHYTEAQCARLVKQMLCSVRYIHSKGIIHRDLKLENFLFSNTSQDSELKMIDFGLSKHFKFGEVQHEAVGTPYTVSPEVIRGTYDECCDVWAIGVITYLLLSGDPPFGGCGGPEPLMQVRSNILSGVFKFEPKDIWLNVSQSARDFIKTLLVTDPNFRPTARECQKSLWLREWANKDRQFEDNKLNPNVVKALVNFKEYSDMRKLLCEVLSFTLLPDQITDLRKEFEKLDTDGSGEISLAGLKQVLIQNAGAGSLGALTEEEVEDVFNAMRVSKTETRIHWHEFIAAGLSQCKVDERNLRLAFERLDSDHKGYITFDNVMDLMGRDAVDSEDAMKTMWGDSMRACRCHNAHITYEDFVLLMKGQTKDEFQTKPLPLCSIKMGSLDVLHENTSQSKTTGNDDPNTFRASNVVVDSPTFISGHLSSVSSFPLGYRRNVHDLSQLLDGPIAIEDVVTNTIPPSADDVAKHLVLGRCGSADHVTKGSMRFNGFISPHSTTKEYTEENMVLADKLSMSFIRQRSHSVDDRDKHNERILQEELDNGKPHFAQDSRRAMLLPEHTHEKEIETLIKDETKTPLVINRKLYRAHRQMRLAVLDASKRFEDEQMRRTRAELSAKQEAEGSVRYAAGLVMRHGHSKELSSESIRILMKQKQQEQEKQLEKATRRGGRGKRTRKKTISDMSSMLAIVPSDEMKMHDKILKTQPCLFENHSFTTGLKFAEVEHSSRDLLLHDMAHRKPTVPGQFRKTNDPFLNLGDFLSFGLGVKNDVVHDENVAVQICESKHGSSI